jgi:hypothetical protein
MDPYLEGQVWEEFHQLMISEIHSRLIPLVRPQYVVRMEQRIYLEHLGEEPRSIRPDVTIVRQPDSTATIGSSVIDAPPLALPLALAEEHRESYLEVRTRDSGDLITVIELLSPSNKRPGARGMSEYLSKREAIIGSTVHLVELDLLRGGQRLPMGRPLPAADFFVILSREHRRPMADVWPFTIRERMPRIPIPLASGDPDVPLDLGAAFTAVYDRAGYDYSLDYEHGTSPPLEAEDAAWAQELLSSGTSRA